MGFLRNLGLKRALGRKHIAFKGHNEGEIGETTRWFCEMYEQSSVNVKGLRDPNDFDNFIKALEDFMNGLIEWRFQAHDSKIDLENKEKLKNLDNSKHGAYSFLLNLLRYEIGPEEFKKIDPQIVMTILMINFEDARLPNAVVKGKSLDNWDIIEIMMEYF